MLCLAPDFRTQNLLSCFFVHPVFYLEYPPSFFLTYYTHCSKFNFSIFSAYCLFTQRLIQYLIFLWTPTVQFRT